MERARFITYQGKRILLVDLSGMQELEQVAAEAERVSGLIRGEPAGSLLVLVDLTGVPYSLRAVRVLGEIAAGNSPHVRARAVVGLAERVRPTVRAVEMYTGSPAEAFEDLETALEWLARQP
jgi:hypothetical protein